MEVITIESGAFKHLINRIQNMEGMMLSMTKALKETKAETENGFPEFVSRGDAMREFQISKTTVDKKCRKYSVSRLQAGGKRLIHRVEFIKALNQKESPPRGFNL